MSAEPALQLHTTNRRSIRWNPAQKSRDDVAAISFYDISQQHTDNKAVQYIPLSSAEELDDLFRKNFPTECDMIDTFLFKFHKATMEQCEIVATLYAVWNNRIIRQQEITDELLKADF